MLTYTDKPIKEPIRLYVEIKKLLATNIDLYNTLTTRAQKIKSLITEIDDIIQALTSSVCIYCKNVCCVNKHSYYELSDIIYLCLIKEEMPVQRVDISDTEPCQFLSKNGCILQRYKRPFRCNWYFCSDLIGHMEFILKRQRRYMSLTMQMIIDTRNEIIEIFLNYLSRHRDALVVFQESV